MDSLPLLCRRSRRVILLIVLFYLFILMFQILFTRPLSITQPFHTRTCDSSSSSFCADPRSVNKKGNLKCLIPQIDPFQSSIVHMITEPANLSCDENFKLLFNSTLRSTLVPAISREEFRAKSIDSCCYHGIVREPDDRHIQTTKTCFPISLENETKIRLEDEFIGVRCSRKVKNRTVKISKGYMDLFPFAPFGPEMRKKFKNFTKFPSETRLNVVIFGIDSVSRANFIREMPKSYEYVMKEMEAIEMEGYNKIGDDTFASIVPMLSSHAREYFMKSCANRFPYYFDNCPLIFKNFTKEGYVTGFAEDAPTMSIFNGIGSGFKEKPADYYLRPFAIASELNSKSKQSYLCQGPRLFFQTLLDYMTKVIYTMNRVNKSLFYFSWATSLTHDAINSPALGDTYLKETLQRLRKNNQLNHTLLILMSDHGMRWGKIQESVQGQLEDRLPFMFFILPTWFKGTYKRAYENLKGNAKKLMTAHDLHYLLHDILAPSNLRDEEILKRETELAKLFEQNDESRIPKGFSLFLSIPNSRNCKHTLIESRFCICDRFELIPKDSAVVKAGAHFAVQEINLNLDRYLECNKLALHKVTMAKQRINEDNEVSYLINFMTLPGEATFEALVVRGTRSWKLVGSVSRTNKYGNQSFCVNDKNVKLFCYCKQLI